MAANRGIVVITPTLAAEWLRYNVPNNRTIVPQALDAYVRDLVSGNWRLEEDSPIVFQSDPPMLLDGQHRLTAIIIADTTMETWVQWE